MVRAKQKQRQLALAVQMQQEHHVSAGCSSAQQMDAVTVLSTQLAVGHTKNMDRAAHIYAGRIAARR